MRQETSQGVHPMIDHPPKDERQSRFIALLIALTIVLLAIPIWRLIMPSSSPGAGNVVISIVFMCMLISAAYAVGRRMRTLMTASALAIPVAVFHILTLITNNDAILIAKELSTILFLGYIIVLGLVNLLTARKVTMDTIAASLCVYMLLGLLWASVFGLTEVLEPQSFVFAHAEGVTPGRFGQPGTGTELYYSLVTLSTLGYGDITPVSSPARLFAATEAIMGQLFLAVLIARLVGLQIAHSMSNRAD